MYYPFVRKALFQLDPERAHEFTFQQLRRITGTPFEALVRQKVPAKPVNCMGLTFKNPLGLAAGLDKDGECIDALGAMGFGKLCMFHACRYGCRQEFVAFALSACRRVESDASAGLIQA